MNKLIILSMLMLIVACAKVPEPEPCAECPVCKICPDCIPKIKEVDVIKEVIVEKECNSSYVLSLIRQTKRMEDWQDKYFNTTYFDIIECRDDLKKCNESYIELNENCNET